MELSNDDFDWFYEDPIATDDLDKEHHQGIGDATKHFSFFRDCLQATSITTDSLHCAVGDFFHTLETDENVTGYFSSSFCFYKTWRISVLLQRSRRRSDLECRMQHLYLSGFVMFGDIMLTDSLR